MIRAEEDSVNKVYVRSETSEEFIFWFRSLQKMLADMKEKEKEIKRRNKMLVSFFYIWIPNFQHSCKNVKISNELLEALSAVK